MDSTNGKQEPSPAPDFSGALSEAQQSGDFEYIMRTARDSDKMLRDFKQAVLVSSFQGSSTRAIAMGLQFLDNMISQSANQIEQLKRTEKLTREAIKAANRGKTHEMNVVGPEDQPEPSAPTQEPHGDPPILPPEPEQVPGDAIPQQEPQPPIETPPVAAEGGWAQEPGGSNG